VTADDLVKIIGAVAGAVVIVLSAMGTLWVRIGAYRREVNGRMTELMDLTREAAEARGRARRPPSNPLS